MINYLRHHEIEKAKWDECIENSVNGLIYGRSWFLDIVCPGWDALVEEDYTAVFPLTHGRKYGICYLYQPYFTQQLGVFSRKHLTADLVTEFLTAIPPKFRFAEIHLNSMNRTDPGLFTPKASVNLELDLINTYENLRKNYDQNAKRNLKKALDARVVIDRKTDPDDLITLFKENRGGAEKNLKFRHYAVLRELMFHCLKNRKGILLGARLPEGNLCASAFLLTDRSRIIFHFAASGKESRETGAMFLLIDSVIRENAGKTITLDFEGSNDPNVARFYKSFGAVSCNYTRVTINRLSWIPGIALKFKKRSGQ